MKTIHEFYPITALYIHKNNNEVTADAIEKIALHYGVPFERKVAEYFELSGAKFEEIESGAMQGPAKASLVEEKKEDQKKVEEKKEEEEPEDDGGIDFDDFFG